MALAALAAHVEEHLRVDSCDLTPQQMLGIAARMRDVMREHELDGLVVTHGSDALEETSFLCDLLLDGEQAIVFTAAMRLPGEPAADGGRNLAAAARLARHLDARGLGALVLAATRSMPPAGLASRTPSGSTRSRRPDAARSAP